MPLTAKAKTERNEEPIPEGVYPAVCYAIYDIGTQYSEKWAKFKPECILVWELHDEDLRFEMEKDGEKKSVLKVISKKYTVSLGDRAILRKHLTSWRGKAFTAEELEGFDMRNVVGKTCNIQIIHNAGTGPNAGKTYANIEAIMPKMKGQPELVPEIDTVYFSIEDHGAGNPPPGKTPEWIANLIMDSKEYNDCLETSVPADEQELSETADEPLNAADGIDDDHTEDSPF